MLMADVRLSVMRAKLGMKRPDAAQVASRDADFQSTESAPATQLLKDVTMEKTPIVTILFKLLKMKTVKMLTKITIQAKLKQMKIVKIT